MRSLNKAHWTVDRQQIRNPSELCALDVIYLSHISVQYVIGNALFYLQPAHYPEVQIPLLDPLVV